MPNVIGISPRMDINGLEMTGSWGSIFSIKTTPAPNALSTTVIAVTTTMQNSKPIQEVTLTLVCSVVMIACLSAVRSVKESTASSVRTCFSVGVVVVAMAIFVKTVKHLLNALVPSVETNVVKIAVWNPVGNVRRNTALDVVTVVGVAMSIFVSVVMKHGKFVRPKNATTRWFVNSAHPSAKSAKDCSAVVSAAARVVHAASSIFAMIVMIFVNARAGIVGMGVNVLDVTRRVQRDLQILILSAGAKAAIEICVAIADWTLPINTTP